MKLILLVVLSLFIIITMPVTHAESIPDWVKNTAGWWAADAISETEFVNAIEFLVNNGIIDVSGNSNSESDGEVPDWVKNTAGWWAADAISETEFVNAIEYLITTGVIELESKNSPKHLADLWKNGDISDNEFQTQVRNIDGGKYFVNEKNPSIPDWLLNNAGWVSARIISNSNFNFDSTYLNEEIFPCVKYSTDISCLQKTTNSYGFRGPEFSENKNGIDFRFFAVGGSTTYGGGVIDEETWPSHLQKIINSEILDKKIEVVNAGISGATTKSESELIKNKIVNFQPDLVIMYDGWNDYNKLDDKTETVNNWKTVCELGNEKGFETIIIVQPLPSTGNRVLTEQEISNMATGFDYPTKSQEYVDEFDKLHNLCLATVDFRTIFDYIQKPVFWDDGHTMNQGNRIIADSIFSVISTKYFDKENKTMVNYNYKIDPYDENTTIYAVGAEFSGKDFSELNLEGAIFDKANLSDTDFTNAKLNGARFAFSNIDNTNLLDRNDLSNINLAGVDISNFNFNGKDLSQVNLSYVDLSNQELSGTNLIGANLSHAKLKTNSLNGKDLSQVNLSYVDLSNQELSGTNLSETILFRTNLSNQDLRQNSINNADFRYANISNGILPDSALVDNKFDYTNLSNIDFSGKSLAGSSFTEVKIKNTDFENTDLTLSNFNNVDFTKIKNGNLEQTIFFQTAVTYSNLHAIKLPEELFSVNFNKSDLTSSDLSNSKIIASYFGDSILTNTDFENTDMSGINDTIIIENRLDLLELSMQELKDFLSPFPVLQILQVSSQGNNIIFEVIHYNNFRNVDFSNADLRNTDFFYADLTNTDFFNADLSNSNLTSAYLKNANLEGANLEGANLEGANLEGANLKCVNHEICN